MTNKTICNIDTLHVPYIMRVFCTVRIDRKCLCVRQHNVLVRYILMHSKVENELNCEPIIPLQKFEN